MQKKLTEEKQIEILETGIAEFAQHGLDRANINVIAKKSGISVGVLYKYYDTKEQFFLACLKRSLQILEDVIREVLSENDKIIVRAEKLIRAVIYHSKNHSNYIAMYNEITAGSSKKFGLSLAEEIEGLVAKTYRNFIEQAKIEGDLRIDLDPGLFAFFFDNLLMMLQFSFSCDYYKERFKVYCGEDIYEHEERIVKQLLKFIESAFTFQK